jgi:hypothetical protein
VAGPSVDLLALLRPERAQVSVAGHRFTLTATTAAQWIGAIALDLRNLHGIMPGLIHDDDLDLMCQLIEEHSDIQTRWFYAARTALGRGAGRDWWWALNLSKRSLGIWTYINGCLLRQGVDAKVVSYPDWLDACYTMLWTNADEEHRMKLDMELGARPPGIAVRTSGSSAREMLASFAAD